jgi:hypothetical protein
LIIRGSQAATERIAAAKTSSFKSEEEMRRIVEAVRASSAQTSQKGAENVKSMSGQQKEMTAKVNQQISFSTILFIVVAATMLVALLLFGITITRGINSSIQKLMETTHKLESDSEIKSYLVEISADLQKAASLADFAKKFLSQVMPRIDADYGAFYILDKQSQRLTPIGGYGALAEELEAVEVGQGLIGQCAKDMVPIIITDPTDLSISIVWGGGEVTPKAVALLPVIQAGHLLGVIALAALRTIEPTKQALLDALLPMVALNLELLNRK